MLVRYIIRITLSLVTKESMSFQYLRFYLWFCSSDIFVFEMKRHIFGIDEMVLVETIVLYYNPRFDSVETDIRTKA